MSDHFNVMAGRLLTESTLQSAIDEASVVHSSTMIACDEAVPDPRPRSGVLAECRICQDEEDEAYMETPCSCRGSLKQFTPNYTATSKLFRNGRNTIFFSTHGYIQGRPMLTADQTSTSYEYDHQTSTPTSVICCRIIALTLMLLLLLHDAFSVFFGDQSAYTVAMVTVSLKQKSSVTMQAVREQVSEPAGVETTAQPLPPPSQQHVISIH
ncbi:hypothetical protein PR202_gb02039 [Eleusine coracana subsp. coracana]|uniref:RING-CH-type domain-containing protein n=1 Tax=Eleusine coracana subsp. coracana TaxID=191504 RepID=A0AAV5DY02_ELECO|nr:hypothetical protein PR202_gb02039 [Eleusine coracana subsp. coracana]